jgi:hypothetical protein
VKNILLISMFFFTTCIICFCVLKTFDRESNAHPISTDLRSGALKSDGEKDLRPPFVKKSSKYSHAYQEWNKRVSFTPKGDLVNVTQFLPNIARDQNNKILSFQGTRPWKFFNDYLTEMSAMFAKYELPTNFVNVGACDGGGDGGGDPTQNLFQKNQNIRGLFIEANQVNVRDFNNLVDSKSRELKDRTTMIHAAVTETCSNKYINFSYPNPLSKDKNGKDEPRWIRREIGRIQEQSAAIHSMPHELNPAWIIEPVRCLTFETLVSEFHSRYSDVAAASSPPPHVLSFPPPKKRKAKASRIHALKIDTEGHDHKILNGIFKNSNISPNQYPLIMLIEVKTYLQEFVAELREMLLKNGYSTTESPYLLRDKHGYARPHEDDIFALLLHPPYSRINTRNRMPAVPAAGIIP